ncbi:alpha/beta hydrolase family protein [Streptomyces sp. UG1]|uniref:alpha/beta hydrolase family protein n=1 Tax=Streptomyces sp. UG1 TaxID=3417652 RepID=UPI003CF8C585
MLSAGAPRFRPEQDLLARNGYVVLHTDYRNHAGSDDAPDNDVNLRLGYTEDVINAVHALRSAARPNVDDGRIGLLGRSMGGGVVYNALVVAPGLGGGGKAPHKAPTAPGPHPRRTGTADDTCPLAWTRATVAAFEAAGKDVELRTYRGEGHTFGPRWPDSMDTTMAFFERRLR